MDREFSDYKKMGIHLNQFMGSSSSIGAKRVRNVCVAFRAASEQNNRAGWARCFPFSKSELCFHFSLFKDNKTTVHPHSCPHHNKKKWSIYGLNLLSIYIFSQNQKHMRHLFNIYSFRCLRALELVEHEYCYLKNKLHELFQVNNKNPKPKTPNSCFISQILVGWSLLSADIIWWLCS